MLIKRIEGSTRQLGAPADWDGKDMGRCIDDAVPTFAALGESIGGAGSWDANPWVWVIEFKRHAA